MKLLLVANRPMTYRTRRLRAGDTFWSPVAEADVWLKLKMARMVAQDEQAETTALLIPPPADPEPAPAPARAWPQANTEPGETADPVDDVAPVAEAPGDASPDLTLQLLRQEYRLLTGKDADKRWGADRLREKMNVQRG